MERRPPANRGLSRECSKDRAGEGIDKDYRGLVDVDVVVEVDVPGIVNHYPVHSVNVNVDVHIHIDGSEPAARAPIYVTSWAPDSFSGS
jgi:hypothetical protein